MSPLDRKVGAIELVSGDVVFLVLMGKPTPGGRREAIGTARARVESVGAELVGLVVEASSEGLAWNGRRITEPRTMLYARRSREENARFAEIVRDVWAPGWRGERGR